MQFITFDRQDNPWIFLHAYKSVYKSSKNNFLLTLVLGLHIKPRIRVVILNMQWSTRSLENFDRYYDRYIYHKPPATFTKVNFGWLLQYNPEYGYLENNSFALFEYSELWLLNTQTLLVCALEKAVQAYSSDIFKI